MATKISDTASSKKPLHIVALGSSFAARPGIQPQALKSAGRSEQNYAHLLAKRLGAQLTDLSVSGATLKNILSEPQVLFGNHFEPQLAALPRNVDIVTITGGGNDLNYIGAITTATLQSYFIGRILSRFMPAPNEETLTAEDVAARFVAVIDKVRETSPDCRIFLVEYLSLFGTHARPGVDVSFDESKIQEFRKIGSTLQTAYKLAAKARYGCTVIPAADLSQDHGLGAEEPWVEGFSIGMLWARKAPFHPNARGMEAVADMIYEELKGDDAVSTCKTPAQEV
jgi:lysophospholipase L1-like esterase